MFKVFIKDGQTNLIRDKKLFNSPEEAEGYFNEQCRTRSDKREVVIASMDNLVRKSYVIQRDYVNGDRWKVCEDLITGKAIHNPKYIISNEEISGRPSVGGAKLPAITVDQEIKDKLTAIAEERGMSVPDIRREAYTDFIDSAK